MKVRRHIQFDGKLYALMPKEVDELQSRFPSVRVEEVLLRTDFSRTPAKTGNKAKQAINDVLKLEACK